VIPALIRKFLEAKQQGLPEVVVWGTGEASREFLYVDDAARGIVLAAERYEKPDPINLGSAQELTIRELVDMIARLTGYDGRITWDRTKPDGQPRRKLNVDRARREFGFESSVDFEDGLLRTIKSYSATSAPTASGEILEAKQSSD
jgi:GDP-L-fucose synthase